jgi:putative acetyltransferase
MSLFRPIQAQDMPELVTLWVKSWQETMPDIDFEARRPAFLQLIEKHIRSGYQIDGLFDDALLGFIAVHPVTGDLDQICVGVNAKGTSAALQLLNHAKLVSPNGLTLKVNVANARAIRFYEREGFVRTGKGVNPQSGLAIYHYRWGASSSLNERMASSNCS